jgi:protein-S-isoprenylcysteine O-methyltransferase Ste14
MGKLIEFLVRQGQKEHSVFTRVLAMIFGGTLFVAIIPVFILWAGKLSGSNLLMPVFIFYLGAFICFGFGAPWMFWAIFWQLSRGKGTPVPVVPTKQFLPTGPYRYTRNPMMLGFFFYMSGWAFLSNHWGAFLAAALLVILLLAELKFIEGPELEKRFGDAYRQYRQSTPFLFPRRFFFF